MASVHKATVCWSQLRRQSHLNGQRNRQRTAGVSPPLLGADQLPKMPFGTTSQNVKIMHKCFHRDTECTFLNNGERSEGNSSPDAKAALPPCRFENRRSGPRARLAGCGKRESVMLSAAKHPLYLIESKQSRSFAFAQDDMVGGFFPQPARVATRGTRTIRRTPTLRNDCAPPSRSPDSLFQFPSVAAADAFKQTL